MFGQNKILIGKNNLCKNKCYSRKAKFVNWALDVLGSLRIIWEIRLGGAELGIGRFRKWMIKQLKEERPRHHSAANRVELIQSRNNRWGSNQLHWRIRPTW